jgi:hypothetical protein
MLLFELVHSIGRQGTFYCVALQYELSLRVEILRVEIMQTTNNSSNDQWHYKLELATDCTML